MKILNPDKKKLSEITEYAHVVGHSVAYFTYKCAHCSQEYMTFSGYILGPWRENCGCCRKKIKIHLRQEKLSIRLIMFREDIVGRMNVIDSGRPVLREYEGSEPK